MDKGKTFNPIGALHPFNSNNPLAQDRVIKGRSFLCSESYCVSYRISARMVDIPVILTPHSGGY